MSERRKVIFESRETKPKRMAFADLERGKTYVAAEEIFIRIGEQDPAKQSSSRDIGAVIIEPGNKFTIDPLSNSMNQDKVLIFENGPRISVFVDRFPKADVLVYEQSVEVFPDKITN